MRAPRPPRTKRSLRLVLAVGVAAALASACGASGFRFAKPIDPWTVVEPLEGSSRDLELGRIRFRASMCEGLDLRPAASPIDEGSLVAFLRAQGVQLRIERARGDLVYLELRELGADPPIRLRVAILADADAAGVELHRALREHGPGTFGLHRANVAVLGPGGRLADLLAFAQKTRLPCWGVMTVAGDDDAFVVGGAYAEP